MTIFDYKLLTALDAVVTYQSFDKAAASLAITQSAISQRIKLLEEQIARPVIVRTQPIALTKIGEKIRSHYKLVHQLEQELVNELNLTADKTTDMAIAVNADSLAIWFTQVIAPLVSKYNVEFNIIVDDENRTLERLKSGEAMAAVSAVEKSIKGFKSEKLGDVKYVLAATPSFRDQYFAKGLSKKSLAAAPAASFDQFDDMHFKFAQNNFQIIERSYPCHFLRSSEAIVNLVKQSAACALIPDIQISNELADKSLVIINENHPLIEPLYWHSWVLVKGQYRALCKEIERLAKQALS